MDSSNSDAGTQIFDQIHEFSEALERGLAAHAWEPLCYTLEGQGNALPTKTRRRLLSQGWERVCTVLEEIDRQQENLSSHSRLLLRACLGQAEHFVGLVLHRFYERGLFEKLVTSKLAVKDLYGGFVQYVLSHTSCLRDSIRELQNLKDNHAKLRKELRHAQQRAYYYVHRVTLNPSSNSDASPSFGKRVVIDPEDPAPFLADGFYIMDSDTSFVLKPATKNHLEIHLLVTKDCPLNDEALKTFIRSSTRENHNGFDEQWLLLVVVYKSPDRSLC
jgi:hypothetical protein